MKHFLLVLQYWEQDKREAEDLIKLIADLEATPNVNVDVMLACRFDSSHSQSVIDYVARKFDVYTHTTRRREVGWPAGPNAMWFDSITRVYELCHAKKIPQYEAILTFEADCAPLRPGWLDMLYADWKRAKVKFMGDILEYPATHMNGNMFLSGNMVLLEKIARKIMGCAPHGGWDFLLAPVFKQAGWFNTPLMRSEWARHKVFTIEELEIQLREGLVFHHGLKNDTLKKAVRDKWVPRKSPVIKKT